MNHMLALAHSVSARVVPGSPLMFLVRVCLCSYFDKMLIGLDHFSTVDRL